MILEKVQTTIEKFALLERGDRVVVAVSGGPDSIVLLYLLNKLKEQWRLYLHIAHLNHLLRNDEAKRDSESVMNLANKLNHPITCANIDVREFAQKAKISVEEAARKLRYNFLFKVAKENSATKIALGHNWNDQAETVLMRFLRGSGISGLRGMPAKREQESLFIIRPLIEIKRDEILDFLLAKNIAYRTDSSNLENLYLRNRVRNQLLPVLKKDFNSNIDEMLVNLAENLSFDFDFLETQGQRSFQAVRMSANGKEVALSIKKLSCLHKAMQRLVARLAIKQLKGDMLKVDYRHWKELEDLLEKRPANSIVDLPGGVSVVKKQEKLVFYSRNSNSACQSGRFLVK